MNYLTAATQIVLLLLSAICTRNYIGDVASVTGLGWAVSGCISSIIFAASIMWIFSSAKKEVTEEYTPTLRTTLGLQKLTEKIKKEGTI